MPERHDFGADMGRYSSGIFVVIVRGDVAWLIDDDYANGFRIEPAWGRDIQAAGLDLFLGRLTEALRSQVIHA